MRHPLRVMETCLQIGCDTPTAIAAILHDVVEDAEVSLFTIREKFGREVEQAVNALTRRDGETYTEFIERASRNRTAAFVKVIDILDNLERSKFDPLPAEKSHLVDRYIAALPAVWRAVVSSRDAGGLALYIEQALAALDAKTRGALTASLHSWI